MTENLVKTADRPSAPKASQPRGLPAAKALAVGAAASTALRGSAALAQGLGELGQNVTGNISGVAKAILVGGFALGLYLVITGLVEFYNANRKPNCSFGGGALKCVIGASLLAVQAVIASFSSTLFGGNESGSGLGTLGF
ncbi:MAG: hypothetical protein LBR80_17090 [Deltaproteobacteria bacterium]|nr:hypothetical protein [Deltaproteobacteria bacterium]